MRLDIGTGSSPTAAGDPARKRLALSVIAVAATAIALRWLVLGSRIGHVDADEAVVGLMARHIWHGQVPYFYWGQAQGGSLEAMLAALSFRIFGTNGFALKLVPLALFGVSSVLVWRVGLRTVGRRASGVALAIFVLGSTAIVWWSTKARGHYSPTLAIELVVLLLILRLTQRTQEEPARHARFVDAVLLGLFLGIGWWESPEVAFVALPAIGWALWRLRTRARRLWVVLPAAVIGAMPWLVYNATHGWKSLRPLTRHGPHFVSSRLGGFFTVGLPEALGFRIPHPSGWIPPVVGAVLYGGCLAVFLGSAFRKRLRLLVLIAVLYPLFLALTRFAYMGDGRYVFFLWPVLALLAGAGIDSLWHRIPARRGVAIVLVAVLSLFGIHKMIERPPVWSQWDTSLPISLTALTQSLEGASIHDAYAPYAIAYPITFTSHERVIVTPVHGVRYYPYLRAVMGSPRPAYLFIDESSLRAFQGTLASINVDPGCRPFAGVVLCRPDQPVPLDEVRAILK